MDIQKIKELALANGFKLKEQASGNMDLHSYVYEFANAIEQAAKAQAVPEEFVLVSKTPSLKVLDRLYAEHDIDDLAGLIKAYEFNFKDDTTHEREHLHRLNISQDILGELHSVFAEPNPVLGYIDSYPKVKTKVDSGELIELYKEILFKMPDYLSKYYSTLARR